MSQLAGVRDCRVCGLDIYPVGAGGVCAACEDPAGAKARDVFREIADDPAIAAAREEARAALPRPEFVVQGRRFRMTERAAEGWVEAVFSWMYQAAVDGKAEITLPPAADAFEEIREDGTVRDANPAAAPACRRCEGRGWVYPGCEADDNEYACSACRRVSSLYGHYRDGKMCCPTVPCPACADQNPAPEQLEGP